MSLAAQHINDLSIGSGLFLMLAFLPRTICQKSLTERREPPAFQTMGLFHNYLREPLGGNCRAI
ncbi:hypothetical protein EP837_03520 [Sphingobium sp. EP60837]|jgi:hypothetical protein|nr:hypothetical protein EP837_03520 [Sphingobium sp. EP60837]